ELHSLFSEFMPNYAQFIAEKQELMPVFALISPLANHFRDTIPELCTLLKSADAPRIEEYKQKQLGDGRISIAQFITHYERLTPENKPVCLQALSSEAKF